MKAESDMAITVETTLPREIENRIPGALETITAREDDPEKFDACCEAMRQFAIDLGPGSNWQVSASTAGASASSNVTVATVSRHVHAARERKGLVHGCVRSRHQVAGAPRFPPTLSATFR